MDPYRVLELSPDASDEEVASAYRRLAKRWHPDVNPGDPDASRKMALLNNAHDEILRLRESGSEEAGRFGRRTGQGDDPDLLIREGRWEEALASLRSQTLRDAGWHFRMAVVFLRLGNPSIAREYAEAAWRMDPRDPDIARLRSSLSGGTATRVRVGNPLWTILKYLFYIALAQGLLRLLFG